MFKPKYDRNYSSKFTPYQVRLRVAPADRSSPRRVLHFIGNFVTGGSSRLVVDLVERLGAGYEHKVVTPYAPTPPSYRGLDIIEEEFADSPRRLHRLIRLWQPDLVHVHYWGADEWNWYHRIFEGLAGCARVPVIENVNTPVVPYRSALVSWYVFVSDFVRQEFAWDDCPNVTIYPGSDFELFGTNESAVTEGAAPVLGMVYRLERDKLNELAIEVFIRTLQHRPAAKALIVGGGSLLKLYQEKVAAARLSDRIEFRGYVSYAELPALYRRMTVFVAPVHKESFGQVTPFAMHMRLPVVGFHVGALAEILGDESLLAPFGDVERLAEIAGSLINDPSRQRAIGAVNYERAHELFSVDSMIAKYKQLYQSLLPSKGSEGRGAAAGELVGKQ